MSVKTMIIIKYSKLISLKPIYILVLKATCRSLEQIMSIENPVGMIF